MGHHYVPQHHLRRFAIEGQDKCIWMYDKETREFREPAIKSVAQKKDYYDYEIEVALASVVEGPGKKVVDKLLNREKIDSIEREMLSIYFMIMLTRGPRQRKMSLNYIPRAMDGVIGEAESKIQQSITDNTDNQKALCLLRGNRPTKYTVYQRASKAMPLRVMSN